MTLDIRRFVDRLGCVYDDPLMMDFEYGEKEEVDIRRMVRGSRITQVTSPAGTAT